MKQPEFFSARPRTFFYLVSLITLSYLFFEFFFIPFEVLAADELVFARHLLDYTTSIPYRDFAPYKSVVGHYLLALPLFFSYGLFAPIFYVKVEIAVINAACIALACYWGSRIFDKTAVLLTMLALLASHSFLIYSTDLRVDMLASWFCLFAALSVLQKRLHLGGILCGIAFLISQKALWYVIAINGAMFCCWHLRSCWRFTLATAAPIFFYLAAWSLIAPPAIVLHNFFYDAYIQSRIQYYLPIYRLCWQVVLIHSPVLFLLWPFTLLQLFFSSTQEKIFTFCFASIALILFILYKQPFPYNFVFTVPAFFLLYSNFLSSRHHVLLTTLFIFTAICYPLYFTLTGSQQLDGTYQRTMTALTAELIKNEGEYVAGMPLLFATEQPIEGMKNLIGPQLELLETQSDTMRPLMLPSLYLSSTTSEKIIDDFERASVKVILSNYRIKSLPASIQQYLAEHYQHFYGSIYLYAPVVHKEQFNFYLKFAGKYRAEAKPHTRIIIDGKHAQVGKVINLKQGDHLTDAHTNYRLVLIPKVQLKLDPAMQEDKWEKMNKAVVT